MPWRLRSSIFPNNPAVRRPASTTGQILAIAEKIDTLAGIFAVGLIPTGDKDPYALRRAALGILRTIIENKLNINIIELTEFASVQVKTISGQSSDQPTTSDRVIDFIFDRLKGYCLDHGYTADEFDAVMAVKPAEPLDFMQRLQAVKAFRQLPEAESLAAANKRIRNILKKSESPAAASVGALVEPAELQLYGKREAGRCRYCPSACSTRLRRDINAIGCFA